MVSPFKRACCTTVQWIEAATGTPKATDMPQITPGPPHWSENIQAMPKPATAIAPQVRRAMGWPVTPRATKAVNKGPRASVMSTLATLVKVNAIMNAVNITAQHRPLSQSKGPQRRSRPQNPAPPSLGRTTTKTSRVNRLRQNVISNEAADSKCRVTTPAVAHKAALTTIKATACGWVKVSMGAV